MRKPALLLIVLLILVVALTVVLNLIWGPFGRMRAGLAEERQLHRLEGGSASCFEDVRPIPEERNAASLYERIGAAREALPESVLLGLDDRDDPVVRSQAVRDAAPGDRPGPPGHGPARLLHRGRYNDERSLPR